MDAGRTIPAFSRSAPLPALQPIGFVGGTIDVEENNNHSSITMSPPIESRVRSNSATKAANNTTPPSANLAKLSQTPMSAERVNKKLLHSFNDSTTTNTTNTSTNNTNSNSSTSTSRAIHETIIPQRR